MMVDCRTGIIKSQRLIGLGTDFSKSLINAAAKRLKTPFGNYSDNINKVFTQYTTKDLLKFTISRYKVGERKDERQN